MAKDWDRYPNRSQSLYVKLLPEDLGKHCRERPAGKTKSEIKLLIQENSDPQDLIVYCTLMAQSPKTSHGASPSSKVRLPSMKTVQPIYGLNLQLDNGDRSSHPCPLLDCLKRLQSDHTRHHPHKFNELATKSEKWNGKPRLECVDG